MVWSAGISGSHMKIFFSMLGFNDLAFGILAAIPYVATLNQLVATIMIERTGLTKYQFVYCAMFFRASWFVLVIIPFLLPIPSLSATVCSLVLLGVGYFTAALADPAWLTWLSDLVPRRIRGRYMANRFVLGSIVALSVAAILGWLIDAVADKNLPETAGAQPLLLWTICGVLLVASVFGIMDILWVRRIREVLPSKKLGTEPPAIDIRIKRPTRPTLLSSVLFPFVYVAKAFKQVIIDPFQDRIFRNYVGYGACIAFTVAVAPWFFWRQVLDKLGFSNFGANMCFLVISPLAAMASMRIWGKIVDKWGNKPTLIISTSGTLLSIMPWFFATRNSPAPQFLTDAVNWLSVNGGHLFGVENYQIITDATPFGAYILVAIGNILGGISWAGVQIAQTNVVMGFADSHGRSKFIAAAAFLTSLGGVLGGVVGGLVAQYFEYLQAHPIGPFLWNNWHATFALSALARFAAFVWLLRMPNPGAARARDLLRMAVANIYNAISARIFYQLRLFGWGRRSDNDSKNGNRPRGN